MEECETKMSGENQSWSSIEVKELLEEGEDDFLNEFAGYTDNPETISFLNYFKNNWKKIQENNEDIPEDFLESKFAKSIISNQSTQLISKALKTGNISILKRFAGKKPTKSSAGLKAHRILEKRLENKYIFYIFGGMESGKTDFALFLSQIWKKENPNKIILSNIKSFKEKDKLVEDWDTLLKEIKERNQDKEKLMIFDEASNHITGYDSESISLAKEIKLFRKVGETDEVARIILIGHSGKDIHPAFRRLVKFKIGDCIFKPSKKVARFYSNVSGGEPTGLDFEIEDIPPTEYHYDTNEPTDWSWGIDEEEKEEEISNKEKVLRYVKQIREEGIEKYLKPYNSKDAYKVRTAKIKKEFDVENDLAYMIREELIDREDIDFNIK
ncbi:hypothetical protein C9439_02230 [archaeon SCG-AAA382B04]|nr:hypothetical protein C9439_02230 [archaeon SCG-AAA382B04]